MIEKELDERRRLAEQVLAASDSMPDSNRHLMYLLGLKPQVLQSRLADLQASARFTFNRPGWMERAVQKARAV